MHPRSVVPSLSCAPGERLAVIPAFHRRRAPVSRNGGWFTRVWLLFRRTNLYYWDAAIYYLVVLPCIARTLSAHFPAGNLYSLGPVIN